MSAITDIVKMVAGVAGGGWGALAAIVALLVGVFVLARAFQKWKEKKAQEDGQAQGAKDQAGVVQGNQSSGAQAAKDDAAAQDALKGRPTFRPPSGEPLP